MKREQWIKEYIEEFGKHVDWAAHPRTDILAWIRTEAEYSAHFSGLSSDPIEEAQATIDAINASQ